MAKELEKHYSLVKRTVLPYDPRIDRENYQLQNTSKISGGLYLFSSVTVNGFKFDLFETYKDREIKLKRPRFITEIRKLRKLYTKKQEIEEKIEQLMILNDEKFDSIPGLQKCTKRT